MTILQNNQKIGTYEVKRLIKQNHYCETYRIEDENGNPFFLKLYILKNTPEKMLNEEGEVNSIIISSKLRHKNLISFIEKGTYSNDSVGSCQYIITEYFNGELLADVLQREGTPPLDQALQIIKSLLEGLDYMHGMGYFHNDITPRNIMISARTSDVELIDLGHVSTYAGGAPPFDTSDLDERYQSGTTFAGMYDNATDLFSAMAVFYTMLTGKVPWNFDFPSESDRKQRIAIARKVRKTPLNFDTIGVNEGIQHILEKSLCINGICKYTEAKKLIHDLGNPDEVKAPKASDLPKHSSRQEGQSVQEEQQATEAHVEIQKGNGKGFQDIAGMNNLKQMLQQKVIFILKDKTKAAKYKLLPPNGMLLYGPPGCGKSFFAEKFAEEAGFNFMLVKASDLGSIYVHGSQSKIADLFKKAQANAPTIICFDEFDAFVPDRSGKGSDYQAGEVNEFLSQLNNCAQRGIFVIATSNRPDKIDPAVLRTGRIDRQIYVPLPDQEARREMFKLHLEGRPCEDINPEKLAELTDGYIASDIAYIVNDAAMGAAFSDSPITQQMLEATISSIRPSINKDVIKTYEDIRCKMEGIDRKNSLPKIGFIQQ